ncbi:MAG: hypothetical protein JWQ89_2847 [Devosia sp.]|uniref:hypothetical protein n=1 Tax=Devosia sp. TaxID=1871048 RepID=UPI0026096AB2|nr:hypothetical protein [Devosia sp.]MDB5541120.1 hypothetical protein [Devosia sp.]
MRRLLALFLLLATPAYAQSPQLDEVRAAWDTCTRLLQSAPDDWTGWRRSFDGGYADRFQFHDGGDGAPSVLTQTWLIDAIATQTDTSCYRPDGSLAFVLSEMTSPNMAQGADGPTITREGRLSFAPDGRLLRVLKRITEAGKEVAPIDNENYQLARGCTLTAPHATVDDVRSHMISELGDIEGTRGEYIAEPLDWCSMETE